MKIQIMSDIHLEFFKGKVGKARKVIEKLPVLADVLALAGDITSATTKGFLEETLKGFTERWDKVFYVSGNHEYYRGEVTACENNIKEVASGLPNLTVLNPGYVHEFQGRRFLGGTMWFPDHPLHFTLKPRMNDFSVIKGFEPWVYEKHKEFRTFIETNLQPGDVVLTHHLPTYEVIGPAYRGDPLNAFYATELGYLIEDREPAAWIHGHSHRIHKTVVHKTVIAACPRNYPGLVNQEFDQGMVLDI